MPSEDANAVEPELNKAMVERQGGEPRQVMAVTKARPGVASPSRWTAGPTFESKTAS